MTELDKVRREIATTEARVLRGWVELELPDQAAEEHAAKIAMIEADTRLLAVLLTRLHELNRSAGDACSTAATRQGGSEQSRSAGAHG